MIDLSFQTTIPHLDQALSGDNPGYLSKDDSPRFPPRFLFRCHSLTNLNHLPRTSPGWRLVPGLQRSGRKKSWWRQSHSRYLLRIYNLWRSVPPPWRDSKGTD